MIRYLLFLLPTSAMCQITFNGTIGYGTYKMKEMKSFQSEIRSNLPDGMRITDEFPGYYYFELSAIGSAGGIFFFGVSATYGSTGGRISYADYSGFIHVDQLARQFSLGIPIGFNFNPDNEKFNLLLDFRPIATISNLDFEFEQKVMSTHDKEVIKFRSNNLAIQPGLMFIRKFGWFGVHLHTAYYQSIVKGELFDKNNDSAYLVDSDNNKVFTDWSGIRVGMGISINLDR